MASSSGSRKCLSRWPGPDELPVARPFRQREEHLWQTLFSLCAICHLHCSGEHMIELVSVLSKGGVPVYTKTSLDTNEMILGPLIEASKSLSAMMGSGEVHRMALADRTLLLTESKKGYTIVALVSRAEDYMDVLLREIAEGIDGSALQVADGNVTDRHAKAAQRVVDEFIVDQISYPYSETVERLWTTLLREIEANPKLASACRNAQALIARGEDTGQWKAFKATVKGSLDEALGHALRGAFDYACAASIDSKETHGKIMALKTGVLCHSITKERAPPVSELRRIADSIPTDAPLRDLARALVAFASGEAIAADYTRAFREATKRFQFGQDDAHLMLGLMFLDPRVSDYPDFAQKMLSAYRNRSVIVCAFVEAIEERAKIFDKLYSITSYDGYRNELALHRSRIRGLVSDITKIMQPELSSELLQGRGFDIGITASLRLQNYIALLTALAESPVLSIGERREVLEEVLSLYHNQFRPLMVSRVPLFSYTLDSVFQSLSVANSEYYGLATGVNRQKNLDAIRLLLSDILLVIMTEWPKTRLRFSLFVVTNAIFPVLARAGILCDEEVTMALLAKETTDPASVDAQQITRAAQFATDLGNTVNSLASVAAQLLTGQARMDTLHSCTEVLMEVHQWFQSHGLVCRDDILSMTWLLSQTADALSDEDLRRLTNRAFATNRVAIQDFDKYESEAAMLASPLLDVLVTAWHRLGDQRYLDDAKLVYTAAVSAWSRYGFEEKAQGLKHKLAHENLG